MSANRRTGIFPASVYSVLSVVGHYFLAKLLEKTNHGTNGTHGKRTDKSSFYLVSVYSVYSVVGHFLPRYAALRHTSG